MSITSSSAARLPICSRTARRARSKRVSGPSRACMLAEQSTTKTARSLARPAGAVERYGPVKPAMSSSRSSDWRTKSQSGTNRVERVFAGGITCQSSSDGTVDRAPAALPEIERDEDGDEAAEQPRGGIGEAQHHCNSPTRGRSLSNGPVRPPAVSTAAQTMARAAHHSRRRDRCWATASA